jgi:hypothetical protein
MGEEFMAFTYQAPRPYLTGNEEAYVHGLFRPAYTGLT